MKQAPDFRNGTSVENVTFPIWAVWAIVVIVAAGAFTSAGILFAINAKLDATWSFAEMREYAAQSQGPDVWEIRRKTR